MATPIDSLKPKYESVNQHLDAITRAITEQFKVPADQHDQVRKAVRAAFDGGHRTTTTDDWCNFF